MLFFIAIHGGLRIMMGQHARSESLFYYFRIEDQVPENHLLRLLDRHISFDFVREKLKDSYSDTGRPSIDPELLLRILLIGYLYGVTSERKLVEELQMHLAWRSGSRLPDSASIRRFPDHSTFSKNRHGTSFQESNLFQRLFEEDSCDRRSEAGLVEGEHLSVVWQLRFPRTPAGRAASRGSSSRKWAHVKGTVREYLADLEQEKPDRRAGPSARRTGIDDGPGFQPIPTKGRSSGGAGGTSTTYI